MDGILARKIGRIGSFTAIHFLTNANTRNLANNCDKSTCLPRSSDSTNVPSNNSKGYKQPRDVIKCYKFIQRKVMTIDGILARKIGSIESFTAIYFAKKRRLFPLIYILVLAVQKTNNTLYAFHMSVFRLSFLTI